VTSWQTFEAIVATLCWSAILTYVALVGARGAWRRWPWRSHTPPSAEKLDAMLRRARRRLERKQLEDLEREGAILWRPDPERVRAIGAAAETHNQGESQSHREA
jgi:hypothetical protein